MKLAHQNRRAVRTDRRSEKPRLFAVARARSVNVSIFRRRGVRLVARWHVSPQTQKLECSWCFDVAAQDDQLCLAPIRSRWSLQASRGRLSVRLRRPERTSLSQIRNSAL